jgi:hypothetical protein
MSDDPAHAPTSAEKAMAANAASRKDQGRQEDIARRNPQRDPVGDDAGAQSYGRLEHAIRRAFDRNGEQVGAGDGMSPEIRASKERSARLLRDASELLAARTNDS